ncbi:MAG: zf-TFIIB domain-containing protein [Pirellulaceae bacterium]|nr:zf-TFIIB domain-containing protein [Pirellulaceae bacterium]
MDCPACRKSLTLVSLNGLPVERCESCRGQWLSFAGFGQLVRGAEPTGEAIGGGSNPVELACPKCRQPMVPFNYAYDSGIFINRCHACDGIWLASGQLERIVRHRSGSPALRRLGDAWAKEIRSENRLQSARLWLRSRGLSTSVAVIYVLAAAVTGGLESVLYLALFLVWPLACIWFPDGMGNLVGITLGHGRPVITQRTPGDFVAIGGWILLLSPLAAVLFIYFAF